MPEKDVYDDFEEGIAKLKEAGYQVRFQKLKGSITRRNLPDYIGCVLGQFMAIEFKRPGIPPAQAKKQYKAQGWELQQWLHAGGVSFFCNDAQAALTAVKQIYTAQDYIKRRMGDPDQIYIKDILEWEYDDASIQKKRPTKKGRKARP